MPLKLCGYINLALFFINGYLYILDGSSEFLIVAILNVVMGLICLDKAKKNA